MGQLRIDPLAFLAGAAAILLLPLDWLLSACLAAAFHELAHLGAIQLCGGKVHSLGIGSAGAVMETGILSPGAEVFCAAAGPLGSFSLLLFIRWMPKLALCALVQASFNLLPLYPLDGGRILRCLAPAGVCRWVERITIFCILTGCLWLAQLDILSLALAGLICFRLLYRKIPCKPGQ